MKPKAIILSGYGLNCDRETQYGMAAAGITTDIIHVNDLISNKKKLNNYQIMVFQGGFSYGDHTGSGNAFANKIKNYLKDEVQEFVNRDTMTIGICNGFQILVNLGLLPALNNNYDQRQVALLPNDCARYLVRFVDLKVTNFSPWLKGIKYLSLPIAHGEGKFYTDDDTLSELKKNQQIALEYYKGETAHLYDLPANPNGSLFNIAGITSPNGLVLGLMPHPERVIFSYQLPDWNKKVANRERISKYGPGMQLFRNASDYFVK